ncbi:glycosyl hydrolase 2 galactose-binding domain-containing protein [Pareuzebyella sediminis]|uniref:glycosyl hydrolase 2 galactose-binding domain-containing protein n=1 Tax=Pareuzebyella sediminis TaxID=2607998 RepID=UPI0011ECBFE2|nr:glycoside hydrolase family 2 TIM barrel-domain containing protein [Pareuzebyella sediminis]
MNPFKINLDQNWKIRSSLDLPYQGNTLSTDEKITTDWLDAAVPSTVLGTLVANKVYNNPYFADNLGKIPTGQFKSPWWYTTHFEIEENFKNHYANLKIDGINYKANIWLNGVLIADRNTINGAYKRFSLDISTSTEVGRNLLAIEVIPPKPGDFSTGFVDWNPAPPDGNMGIFRPVYIELHGGVRIENPFVQSRIDAIDKAELIVSTELHNDSDRQIEGHIQGSIGQVEFSRHVNLMPGEMQEIVFDPSDVPQLIIENPKLWWPIHMGPPDLYELHLQFNSADKVHSDKKTRFGIRKVSDYWIDGVHRGFKINGQKVLIKGAGWTDDLLLMDTHETVETQVRYVKQMNLNCIRLEGFWGNDQRLYDLCDELGILLMVGWSCHWEHEIHMGVPVDERFGGVYNSEDIAHVSQAWQDQVIWLRNHPSIFVWTVASDKVPITALEQKYIETFATYDPTRPYLNSTGGVGSDQHVIGSEDVISEISGSSGVKMLGPYDYTAPVYWYSDTKFGGAYGFNTETGPGAQIPQLDSLKKFIPEEKLWPINDIWNYHCGLYEFNNLDRFTRALNERYGAPNSIEEFDTKAQAMNYELMRPMFEAFQVNKTKSTGIIQWMLNAAWPKMYWQLYDYYLRPTAAFYAVQKACTPLHLVYNYDDHHIYLINDHFKPIRNLTAVVRLYDIDSQLLSEEETGIDALPDSSTILHEIQLPESISSTYFIDLRLKNALGTEIDRNFYWLSTKEEVLDYEADLGEFAFHTPSKQYSDLSQLNMMERIRLNVSCHITEHESSKETLLTIENDNPTIAFLINLELVDKKTGENIVPVYWNDNFITLTPYDKRTVRAVFESKNQVMLRLKGWNVAEDQYEVATTQIAM